MIINQSVSGGGLKTITNVYNAYTGGALSLHELFMCLDSSAYYNINALGWISFPVGLVCSVESFTPQYSQYSVQTGSFSVSLDTAKLRQQHQAQGTVDYECVFDGSVWSVSGESVDGSQIEYGDNTQQELADIFGFTVSGNVEEGDGFSVTYHPEFFSVKSYSQGNPIYREVSVDAADWQDDGETSSCVKEISDIVCGDSPVVIITMNNADMESFIQANGYVDYVKNIVTQVGCGLDIRLACDTGNTPYLSIQMVILPSFGGTSANVVLSTGEYGIQP